MNIKIIIFGAGEWGKMAYYYYMDKCEIVCFVDNSSELWGKKINNIEICNPQVLHEMDLQHIRIVIANKCRNRQIFEQLNTQFGISECIFFRLEIVVEDYIVSQEEQSSKEECIIEYRGGLGNQMFQYALAKCLKMEGSHVTSDISAYYMIGGRSFILQDVFPTISIEKCNWELKRKYKENRIFHIKEESILTVDKKKADVSIIRRKEGYFEGYWQSNQFAKLVEKELRNDFRFKHKSESKLSMLSQKITKENAVSVHIRRGDYLERSVRRYFGNICTDDYYERAIEYIKKNVKSPIFYLFSNDIKWVEEKYRKLDAVCISEDMFDSYEDWYDMFLMSCCKYNIIANSTFSWWGAWLNSNENKIVIAPSKWINDCEICDIYPTEWIQI